MVIFRDALAAIAPILERAHIHSDDLRAYDDWDEIAQALFDNIVVRSIQWSAEVGADIDLGRYATLGQKRSRLSELVVRERSGRETTFHSFASRQRPFDTVKVLEVGGTTTSEIALDDAEFALRIPGRDGLVEAVTVQL